MLAPSGGGLILYQAYGNLYAMTGRKAHLLEDKQIPSVGVFDEVYVNKHSQVPFNLILERLNSNHAWKHLKGYPQRDSTFQSISRSGYPSLGHALFRWLWLLFFCQTCSTFFLDIQSDPTASGRATLVMSSGFHANMSRLRLSNPYTPLCLLSE
ncbi:hypothetical protein Tco_0388763 [Tanacetum coccineum]